MRCRECGEDKRRLPSGRRKDRNGFYYRDEQGKLWNGLKCPACFRKTSFRPPRPVGPIRFCRLCKKALPADRYFNHEYCFTEIYGKYEEAFIDGHS